MAWWFRMHNEFVHDPKVQKLPGELFKFWVNCLGLTSQQGGELPPLSDVAWKLNLKEKLVVAYVAKLNESGLLDQDGPSIVPHNWAARQFKSDVSTDRVRRFRNKNETFPKRDETVSVTAPELVVEPETEKNTEPPKPCSSDDERGGVLFPVAPLVPRKEPKPKAQVLTSQQVGWFTEWWAIYWRTGSKKDAVKAFSKHVRTEGRFQEVMIATRLQSPEMLARDNATRPLGATWLNAERWEDPATAARASPQWGASVQDKVKALALERIARDGHL